MSSTHVVMETINKRQYFTSDVTKDKVLIKVLRGKLWSEEDRHQVSKQKLVSVIFE